MSTWIDEDLRVNHQTLTTIRFIENRIHPLLAIFASLIKTLEALEKLNETISKRGGAQETDSSAVSDLLKNFRSHINGYVENAKFLLKRSGGIAQQLSDTLAFKNQLVAQSQNNYMLKLTMSTVDDSSTIRVVTLVTLVYLPFSFMAVGIYLAIYCLRAQLTHRATVDVRYELLPYGQSEWYSNISRLLDIYRNLNSDHGCDDDMLEMVERPPGCDSREGCVRCCERGIEGVVPCTKDAQVSYPYFDI
jgi:hypothetical protein